MRTTANSASGKVENFWEAITTPEENGPVTNVWSIRETVRRLHQNCGKLGFGLTYLALQKKAGLCGPSTLIMGQTNASELQWFLAFPQAHRHRHFQKRREMQMPMESFYTGNGKVLYSIDTTGDYALSTQ